jgi:hypothetical protein
LNDGRIQNPSNTFGIVPLSRFVPRGFGFVHHSIAILYHEVPNPNLTIRNFFIAVWVEGGLERWSASVGLRRMRGCGRTAAAASAPCSARLPQRAAQGAQNHHPAPRVETWRKIRVAREPARTPPHQRGRGCAEVIHTPSSGCPYEGRPHQLSVRTNSSILRLSRDGCSAAPRKLHHGLTL